MTSLWGMLAKPAPRPHKDLSLWNLLADPNTVTPGGPDDPDRPSAVYFNERSFYWAMRNIPEKYATQNMLVCGIVGSGKTTVLQLFLQSIAQRFHPDRVRPEQLIVFDAKGDALPRLAALGLHEGQENFWVMNPADVRSAEWSLGDAAQTPLMARQIAALLVPEEKNSSAPYFTDAARELVLAVIFALTGTMRCNWTFRDLICALDSKATILATTKRHPRARVIVERIFADERHAFGALSTLGTKLGPFEQVAALWHSGRKRERFSVAKFLSKAGVLVLGNDPALKDSLWPVNAILLKALTQEILRGPETQRPRHWFLLDEFPGMNRVECIHDLLNRGRSKGASVALGFQSIEGLSNTYGENTANEIMGQCAHKTFLRAGSPKTAAWAESYFGKVRQVETTVSESYSWSGGHTVSYNRNRQERSAFLASTFLDLPLPALGGTLASINDVPSYGTCFINSHLFDHVLSMCVPAEKVPAFQPRPDPSDQNLKPWSAKEVELYCKDADAGSDPSKPARKPRRKASDFPTRRQGNPPPESSENS